MCCWACDVNGCGMPLVDMRKRQAPSYPTLHSVVSVRVCWITFASKVGCLKSRPLFFCVRCSSSFRSEIRTIPPTTEYSWNNISWQTSTICSDQLHILCKFSCIPGYCRLAKTTMRGEKLEESPAEVPWTWPENFNPADDHGWGVWKRIFYIDQDNPHPGAPSTARELLAVIDFCRKSRTWHLKVYPHRSVSNTE